jgi:hypothetical protein
MSVHTSLRFIVPKNAVKNITTDLTEIKRKKEND